MGITVDERVKEMQRGLMWSALFSALFGVVLKSIAGSIWDLSIDTQLIVSFVAIALYVLKSWVKYLDMDIYKGYEVYTYKNKMYRMRDKTDSSLEEEINTSFGKGMVLVSASFYGLCLVLWDVLIPLRNQVSLLTFFVSAVVAVISLFPFSGIYLWSYVSLSGDLKSILEAPLKITVLYDIYKNTDKKKYFKKYGVWEGSSSRKRKKLFTKEEQAILSEMSASVRVLVDSETALLPMEEVSEKDVIFKEDVDDNKDASLGDKNKKSIQEYDIADLTSEEDKGEEDNGEEDNGS